MLQFYFFTLKDFVLGLIGLQFGAKQIYINSLNVHLFNNMVVALIVSL